MQLLKQLYKSFFIVPGICVKAWISNQMWLYQLERMGEGNTKPSICCGYQG
jgi:hypothetical protein